MKFLIILFIYIFHVVTCTNDVPVLLFQTKSNNVWQNPPAFGRITTDTFSDMIRSSTKGKDVVIVFAEENLSTEDFNLQDTLGHKLFSKLNNLTNELSIRYLPIVENPMSGLREKIEWKEYSLSNDLIEKIRNDEKHYIIVKLNDAIDYENRVNMLQRHDTAISEIIESVRQSFNNILMVYTGYHASWFSSSPVLRISRSLLEDKAEEDEGPGVINGNGQVLFYSSNFPVLKYADTSLELKNNISVSVSNYTDTRDVDLTVVYDVDGTNVTLILKFRETAAKYWSLNNITVMFDNILEELINPDVTAKYAFSYHCTQEIIYKNDNMYNITYKDLQAEPFPKYLTSFGDTYDCVWFFTIPILSGILVTILLASILGTGITMIYDIKTMDRFDDPKGKTITITATE